MMDERRINAAANAIANTVASWRGAPAVSSPLYLLPAELVRQIKEVALGALEAADSVAAADRPALAIRIFIDGRCEAEWTGDAVDRRVIMRRLAIALNDECLHSTIEFIALLTPDERNELRRRLEACK